MQFSDVKLKEQSFFVTVNETLDSILDESGDEEEQDAVVNQVLDEIGIEISGKVSITAIFFLSFFFSRLLNFVSLKYLFVTLGLA